MITNSIAGKEGSYQPVPVPASPANMVGVNKTGDVANAVTQPAKPEQVQEAIDQIQKFTQTLAQNLNFSIDEETGKTVVKVMDTQTNEVIRQIPSAEAIDIARTIGKIQGTLFNDKA